MQLCRGEAALALWCAAGLQQAPITLLYCMSIDRSLFQTQLLELSRFYPGSRYSDGSITVPCPVLHATFTLFLSSDYPWSPPLVYIVGDIPPQLRCIVDKERRVRFPAEGQWAVGTQLAEFIRQLEKSISATPSRQFQPEEAKRRIAELKGTTSALQKSNDEKQAEIARVEAGLKEELRARLAAYAQLSESLLAAYRSGRLDAATFQLTYTQVRTGWHQVQSLLLTCFSR